MRSSLTGAMRAVGVDALAVSEGVKAADIDATASDNVD